MIFRKLNTIAIRRDSWLVFILFGIYFTPIFNVGELMSVLFQNESRFVYLKILRTAFVFFPVLYILFFRPRWHSLDIFNVVLFWFVLFSSLVCKLFGVAENFVYGVLWFTPFYFMFWGVKLKNDDVNSIYNGLFFIVSVGFLLQLIQLFFMRPYYGHTFFGLSSRPPGLFITPSTMGVTSAFTLVLGLYLNKSVVSVIVCVLSAFLSGSGAALLISIAALVSTTRRHMFSGYFVIFFLFFTVTSVFLLPSITGRLDIFTSPLGRVAILFDFLDKVPAVFPMGFGDATNSAVNYGTQGLIADSSFNSMLLNTGFLYTAIFLASTMYKTLSARRRSLLFNFSFFVIFFNINISELYPIGIVSLLLFPYFNTLVEINTRSE